MATVTVIKRFFGSKEEAIADIKNEGFWPFAWMDKPGDSFEPHCHANDERLYLVEGALEFEDVGAHKVFLTQAWGQGHPACSYRPPRQNRRRGQVHRQHERAGSL